MMSFSPMTARQFRSFRRMRRAWWSLLALGAVFAFCLCAEWVCPCDPQAVVDVATLAQYRRPVVARTCAVRTARFSVDGAGRVYGFEGPDAVREIAERNGERLKTFPGGRLPAGFPSYRVHVKERADHIRYFLEPKEPPTVTERILPPEEVSFPFRPVPGHPFGIDAGGRDVYARVVHGLRISLLFGLLLALAGTLLGLAIGAAQGYFGGVTDLVCQRVTEVWQSLPFLYVMLFVGATVGRSFGVLLLCYALFGWITVADYMRAEFLRLRRRTFVEAARVLGLSAPRIILVHILPNALAPLVTLFPFLLLGAIGSLATLDFLGFGLPPMTPSCGELLAQAQQFRHAWWLILFPGAALFVAMLLTALVGEGLRDAFDPRHASRLE